MPMIPCGQTDCIMDHLKGARLRANRAAAAVNGSGAGGNVEEEDESDASSSEGELEEELDVETALDKVDPYVTFKTGLTGACRLPSSFPTFFLVFSPFISLNSSFVRLQTWL